MAETFPLTAPTTVEASSVEFGVTDVVALNVSPLSFSTQAVRHQGQQLSMIVKIPPMNREEFEEWSSFLQRLRGMYGTFLYGIPNSATARGSASSAPGTPVVKGASQTGYTLEIDGAPNSATGYLKMGDYVGLGTGATATFHKVLEDANSDGSGNVTLNVYPDLRTSPADNETVVVANAKGVFRRAENVLHWSLDVAAVYGIAFPIIEAL